MYKIFVAAAIVLFTSSLALADAINGVPSPYSRRNVSSPISGNVNGWVGHNLRIPQVRVERRSIQTRKYGQPVGWCNPVKGSSGGIVGKWLGWGHVTYCR